MTQPLVDPAKLALLDRQLANTGQGLDLVVKDIQERLANGEDRTIVIAAYIAAQYQGLATGAITVGTVMRTLALAAARLAEAGEPK